MSKIYIARLYQGIITNHIIDNPRCAVWAGMGLGKTVATLTAIDILMFAGEVSIDEPVLVLAPLRVAQSTWPDEAAKWQHLKDIKIVPITGNERERRQAVLEKGHVFTINYENLPWLVEYFRNKNTSWPFKTIVADEATKLKGFRMTQGTLRARSLATVAHSQCRRFIELSGTPAPNGLKDLWGQLWFIDGGVRLGRSFSAFAQRWFHKAFDGYGVIPHEHSQDEIQAKVKDLCVSLKSEDYFDLKEPIETVIEVILPPKARRQYKDMEDKMFTEIGEHEVEAFNAAARTQKCLQLANGAAYVQTEEEKQKDVRGRWEEVHDVKLKALEDIIEEAAGMPVLVAYNFRSDLERLRDHFPTGKVLDKDPRTIRDWNAGKIPILFAHPASAGHGLNLQDGGNILVFFAVNWNLEEHLQIIERIGPVRQMQAGYNRNVFIYYILAKDTVDYMVMDRLKSKREVQDILLEAMKHRSA